MMGAMGWRPSLKNVFDIRWLPDHTSGRQHLLIVFRSFMLLDQPCFSLWRFEEWEDESGWHSVTLNWSYHDTLEQAWLEADRLEAIFSS